MSENLPNTPLDESAAQPSPALPPDPVPPLSPEEVMEAQEDKKNMTPIILGVLGALILACICFALGIVFGIWAWENGDSWFGAVLPALALL